MLTLTGYHFLAENSALMCLLTTDVKPPTSTIMGTFDILQTILAWGSKYSVRVVYIN